MCKFLTKKGAPSKPGLLTRLPLMQLMKGDRIVGGVEAQPNEFPFQVSLQIRGLLGGQGHICGGIVYNENWIIDAAHCVIGNGPYNLQVVAGEHNLAVMSGMEQYRNVSLVVVHPGFDANTFENDISLIKLAEPLDFSTGKVGPIAIIDQGLEVLTNTTAWITGWGSLSDGSVATPDKLHKAIVPIVSDADCKSSYGSFQIYPSMICAGLLTGGIDTCQGDSGGPLFTRNPDTLIGITSWGEGCAKPRYPGVYTKIAYLSDWIKSVVNM